MKGNGRKWLEIVFLLALTGFFVLYAVVGSTYPPRPRELPVLVAGVSIVLCVLELITLWRKKSHKPLKVNWRKVGYCFLAMALFLLLTWILGMAVASAVFVAGLGMALGATNKVGLAVASLGTAGFIYLVFVYFLHLGVPTGILTGF